MATKCEKHGLHYDPSVSEGCVLCRRESNPPIAAVGQPALETNSKAMSQALMVTAGLILITTLTFDLAHEAAVDFVQNSPAGIFLGGGSPSSHEMETPVDPQLEEIMKELDILFGEKTEGELSENEDLSEEELFD